jgi:4-phosphopantoate--beta-alanine ligase
LIGEKTTRNAHRAIRAAAALLLIAKHPVISVNGNLAALCPREIVDLAGVTGAEIEVNLFYRTRDRERAIRTHLQRYGAKNVLGVRPAVSSTIPELRSKRRKVDSEGILVADVVFVPLEDGDRSEALAKMGKKVITVDLNPLSRTARTAHVTIVDNIIRSMPALVQSARSLKGKASSERLYESFDNRKNLREAVAIIRGGV